MIDKIGELTYKSINAYGANIKPIVNELKFKEEYQGRIIDCMVGEVDDNYIETPETDSSIVKLEHSKEGLVKVPTIKGKTILVDAEGNETDTPAEGCRLVSVGEEEDNKIIILSKNKNLNSKVYWGNIYNGVFNSNTTSICSEYIRAYEGINYTSSIRDENDVFYYVLYDLNKNYIETMPPTSRSFTAPYDCYFRCWRTKHNTNNWLQVEIDNQTLYVEPKQHKTEISLKEPLRSLPNGVCDEIVGNQLIRRVGKVRFTDLDKIGVKNSISWGSNNSHGAYQYMNVSSGENKLNYKYSNNKNTPNIVTNLYPYDNAWHGGNNNINSEGLPEIFFGISNDGHARLMVAKKLINPENPSSVNHVSIMTWVEKNLNLNFEILYELSEPIIEELPNSITLQGFDDTTMYIENSITPTVSYGYNALIPYKQALKEQKEEVETNTLDIEQNIIPYLMDMEFNLMLMEGE